jgi:antitoxin ParD1/3/4
MTNLNISLPEAMKEFIEGEVKRGAYSTPSEFVRELVRDAQKRTAKERQESLIDALVSGESIGDDPRLEAVRRKLEARVNERLAEALRSGGATEMTARDWAEIRRRVLGEKTRKGGNGGKRAGKKARTSRRRSG